MMSDERKKYDTEFKQKAVELSYARDSTTEIAEESGIQPQMLYRWRWVFQVSKSGYYAWLKSGPSKRWQENETLLV